MTDAEQPRLTARQRDVLREIANLEERGTAATTTRLATSLDIPRQNVRTYLLALRDQELVLYEAHERQNAIIRLTGRGRALLGWNVLPSGQEAPDTGAIALPIVGEVAAGEPSFAEQHIEGYAARLQDLLDVREGDFLLRVRGDSMIGVGIYPGDLVAIHPLRDEPHSGEIALVVVPGEDTATLKRWHRNNGTVTLISENPAYPAMKFPAAEVQVQGCLVGHIGRGRTRRTSPSQE